MFGHLSVLNKFELLEAACSRFREAPGLTRCWAPTLSLANDGTMALLHLSFLK